MIKTTATAHQPRILHFPTASAQVLLFAHHSNFMFLVYRQGKDDLRRLRMFKNGQVEQQTGFTLGCTESSLVSEDTVSGLAWASSAEKWQQARSLLVLACSCTQNSSQLVGIQNSLSCITVHRCKFQRFPLTPVTPCSPLPEGSAGTGEGQSLDQQGRGHRRVPR